ncbi:NADP-dependent 3-hydroxy acid dehydrogenase YdfG [Chitinophaga rupis]|uniref:NADP-dependent 3-hydroxy acid dehydrogenase YdfG n=1 Tax=Chitinophaga rupis TaxID=573321 RepID=A0A1H7S1S3_9BACT|nr:SDR family oxidoreductase [Chitinophaga rupis]SEL66453.1 NADP-dependent 3-hydroxy acid dehydrogenase YdfG [Chitinophaga rupis]
MKTIFITGTSSGLGKAAVQLFAARGWKVIATMRSPEKETELTQLDNVHLLKLDVANAAQIDTCVQQALALGPVDVVVNNAGYGLVGPLESYTDEQITTQLDTNLLGVIRIIKAFTPHFREKKSGLFINITSIGGLITVPFSAIYHASKWALEGLSESLSFEFSQLGIGIKTVSPGAIKTDFGSRSMQTGQPHAAYGNMMEQVFSVFGKLWDPEKYSSAETIAEVVYEAATDGKDQLRYQAGEDAKAFYAQRLWQGAELFRKGIQETVFSESEVPIV